MNRIIFSATLLACLIAPVLAQDEKIVQSMEDLSASDTTLGWTNMVSAASHISQNRFHNWSEGGDNTLTWLISLEGQSDRDWETMAWESELKLNYGRTQINDESSRKSSDEIFFETLYRYKLPAGFSPYVSGRFETQFTAGYEYPDTLGRYAISAFMDPGYLTESAGMGWKPNKVFDTRLGFALKQTFSDQYGWADDPETAEVETFKNEPGLESISTLNWSLNEILGLRSRLSVFVNFEGVEQVDGSLENSLTAQVAPWFEFDFGLDFLYDYDLDDDTQIRQNMSAALVYRLL